MDEVLERLFSQLPAGSDERIAALLEIHRKFHDKLATNLSPVIQELIQHAPLIDEEARRVLSSKINHVLNETSLALVDPTTGTSATLVCEQYRFRLQSRQIHDGKRFRSKNTMELPPIEVIFCPRREAFSEWRNKAKEPCDHNPRIK